MTTLKIIFWIAAFLVFYTYIGYGLIIFVAVKIKEAIRGRRHKPLPEPLPEVTILIAAYNEEDIVEQKMQNTLALDYPQQRLSIVWVTDGSTDSTPDRLAQYDRARVMHSPQRRGKSAAIHRAMPTVHSPIVIFTDANTMICPEAVKAIVAEYSDPKVGCVAGEKRVVSKGIEGATSGEGIYWRYESKLKDLDARLYTSVGAAGELFSIRTALYEDLGSDTLLDDLVMSLRIAQQGYTIAYAAEAYALEEPSADMHEERKRKVRIAAGGLQSIWRLRTLLNPFRYGMLSFQYVSHRVLRWSITPLSLVVLFGVSIAIVASSSLHPTIYDVALTLQILFYALALGGWILSERKIKARGLYVPYYFTMMNLNPFWGIGYLLKNKGRGSWDKAKRSNNKK